MATIKKVKGKNVRISDKAHKTLSAFCKKHGYQLGTFCEIGALNKMQGEVYQKL